MESQSACKVLMVRPIAFGFNEQTATTNAFQNKDGLTLSSNQIQQKALVEFDSLMELLQENGVEVIVINDTLEPHKPDSIFPNNWFSTHANGDLVLYPMRNQNRQWERRSDIIDLINSESKINQTIDLTHFESQHLFLEGTGSLILDRPNKLAYVAISPRADWEVIRHFCEKLGYTSMVFNALDQNKTAIYHTNVMMCLATHFAVICLEAITDLSERENVITRLEKTNKKIIEISVNQMNSFAGNMLELKGKNGFLLAMSTQAYQSLNKYQIADIERFAKIIHSDINTIETLGGGSVRCMLAELY